MPRVPLCLRLCRLTASLLVGLSHACARQPLPPVHEGAIAAPPPRQVVDTPASLRREPPAPPTHQWLRVALIFKNPNPCRKTEPRIRRFVVEVDDASAEASIPWEDAPGTERCIVVPTRPPDYGTRSVDIGRFPPGTHLLRVREKGDAEAVPQAAATRGWPVLEDAPRTRLPEAHRLVRTPPDRSTLVEVRIGKQTIDIETEFPGVPVR